ncbi:glycosyl hydrolase family 3 N terminal domain-containing protein [Aspergillus novoparasiticus]|uniref:Probable beta-glucosidase M n=1 Tax=Aspergillus novoparasiticus TaxID=986946 RepID=A0A5N6F5A4_9EURO|nr:glycosyl hydrolase family 3 N terminal domain-containing protein [Aspergillus novoparasiticus]
MSTSWGKAALLLVLALNNVAVADDVITSDTYFYGDSPAVYPSPEGTGAGDWPSAYNKAKAFVGNLSDDEKVNLTAGVSSRTGCSGYIQAINRLGFPGICVSDAGNGLRATDYVNGWTSGISVGASWNRNLAHDRGTYMGKEYRKKGVNMILGPVVGPLGRVALGGRNWEGFSTDPYLSGILVSESVTGFQSQKVATSVKHFIGNEQETNRNPTTDSAGNTIESVSSNIDDKTIHELYLWPFQDAVLAGATNIMCSYNRLNNSYGCQNSKALNGLLKTELGFQGYVVTDWGAQHAGIAGANAGLDVVMPSSETWNSNLTTAIANGTMKASRLDDMITRLMATWYYLDQDSAFPNPGVGMPSSASAAHQAVNATSQAAKPVLLQAAVESHVLVKNTKNALPLKSPKLISVFGYDAYGPMSLDLAPSSSPDLYQNGTLWVGGGSGTNSPAYLDAPIDAIQGRAYDDGSSVLWDFTSENPSVDYTSDVCLVFINAYATEGSDRKALSDSHSDTIVTNVATNCANTVVVVHNAGIRTVESWVDHVNVTGIIFAHLPGQDTGRALVEILYGDTNPSGRLPYTVAKNGSDYGSLLEPAQPEGKYEYFPQSNFDEGVYIDYRAFDKKGIEPQYAFGYGLSYTTFDYSDLNVSKKSASPSPYPAKAAIVPGGNPRLFDELVTVTATVKNTGSVDGKEVAQLYVGIPNGPVRQLRGFDKVLIKSGQSTTVSFSLTRRDLSTWDTDAQEWLLQPGTYKIYVGRNSRDLPLEATLTF